MTKEELCKLLKETTYLINVFQNNEHVSSGTGVSINSSGDLITAAHVISGRLPVRDKDLQNLVIQGRTDGKPFVPYNIVYCGLSVNIEYLKKPITIDLALLKNTKTENDRKYLSISRAKPIQGNDIMMAGFSDEVEMPFSFNRKLNYDHPYMKGHEDEIKGAIELWLRISIAKSGMIGRADGFNINEDTIKGFTMYIDNAMHSGSSGGPVINLNDELIGIITQRAVTSFSTEESPGLYVPSGSTIAVSPYPILDYYKYENKTDYL